MRGWKSCEAGKPDKEDKLIAGNKLAVTVCDHISDVIFDHAITSMSAGTEGTLGYKQWCVCDECQQSHEDQSEIQHSKECQIGHIQNQIDDIRNPKL